MIFSLTGKSSNLGIPDCDEVNNLSLTSYEGQKFGRKGFLFNSLSARSFAYIGWNPNTRRSDLAQSGTNRSSLHTLTPHRP